MHGQPDYPQKDISPLHECDLSSVYEFTCQPHTVCDTALTAGAPACARPGRDVGGGSSNAAGHGADTRRGSASQRARSVASTCCSAVVNAAMIQGRIVPAPWFPPAHNR